MKIEFTNDGQGYSDNARCCACGFTPADTEVAVDGEFKGYVCGDCQKAAKGGVAEWRRHLERHAENLRAIVADPQAALKIAEQAERAASGMEDSADIAFHLTVPKHAEFVL